MQVWPAAGAAKQSVDVNDPASIDVRSSLIVGAEANVMKPVNGPDIGEISRIDPDVLLSAANEPEFPVLLTAKVPFGGPTGG